MSTKTVRIYRQLEYETRFTLSLCSTSRVVVIGEKTNESISSEDAWSLYDASTVAACRTYDAKVIQPAEPRLNVAFRFELFKIFLFHSMPHDTSASISGLFAPFAARLNRFCF